MRRVPLKPHDMPAAHGKDASHHVVLPDEAAHYLRDVLRLSPGASVELFDGTGRSIICRLVQVQADAVTAQILEDRFTDARESPCQITLVQAIPKGDRWTWLIEKATELGVSAIVPLQTRRTVVNVPAAKHESKLLRWRKIAAGAARQSGRSIVPKIAAIQTIDDALASLPDMLHLVAHPTEEAASLTQVLTEGPHHHVAVWIGPEGGFTPDELDHLGRAGASAFVMGPRVLRSETAGLTAITLIQARCGDLG